MTFMRQPIYVDTLKHKNPTPAACRVGNLIMSGGIHGADPHTGIIPDDLDTPSASTSSSTSGRSYLLQGLTSPIS